MQRFSKKRQSILDLLRSTKSHPDAEWVYLRLKPLYPDISLATVYRNLRQLTAEGLIRSVGVVEGEERFDADTTPHVHAVCTRCGGVLDVPELTLPEDFIARARALADFDVTEATLRFYGVCAACRAAEKGKP